MKNRKSLILGFLGFAAILLGADSQHPLLSKVARIEEKLRIAETAANTDRWILQADISTSGTTRVVHFKDSRVQVVVDDLISLKNDLKKNIDRIDTGTKTELKVIPEAVERYLNIQSRMYVLYAKMAHLSDSSPIKFSPEHFARTYDFNDLNGLNLVLEKTQFVFYEIVRSRPFNVRHINARTLEVFVNESDRAAAELGAILEPKTDAEYANLVQFAAIQERFVNRWALRRLSLSKSNSPTLDRCGERFLSFRIPENKRLYDSAAYLDLEKQETNIALSTHLNSLAEKMNDASMPNPDPEASRLVSDAEIPKTWNHTLGNQKTAEAIITKALNLIPEYAESTSQTSPEELKKLIGHFSAQVVAHEIADWNALGSSTVVASLFFGDDANKDELADRILESSFARRKEAFIKQAYSLALTSILPTDENNNPQETSKDGMTKFKRSISSSLDRLKSQWKSRELALVSDHIAEFFSKENQLELSKQRFEEKVDQLVSAGTSAVYAVKELKTIESRYGKNPEKLKKNYNNSEFWLRIESAEQLRQYYFAKTQLPEFAPVRKRMKSNEKLAEVLKTFFIDLEKATHPQPAPKSKKKNKRNQTPEPVVQVAQKSLFQTAVELAKKAQDAFSGDPEPYASDISGHDRGTTWVVDEDEYHDPRWPRTATVIYSDGAIIRMVFDAMGLKTDYTGQLVSRNSDFLTNLLDRTVYAQAIMGAAYGRSALLRNEWTTRDYAKERSSDWHLQHAYSIGKTGNIPEAYRTWTGLEYMSDAITAKGGLDQKKLREVALTILENAKRGDQGKLEDFCLAKSSDPDHNEKFQSLFKSSLGIRAAFKQEPNLRKFDETVEKRARTTSEKILQDYLEPALNIGMAIFLAGMAVMFVIGTGGTGAAVLATIFSILNYATFAVSGVAVYYRLTSQFYEMPLQLQYTEALTLSQASEKSPLIARPKDVKDLDLLKEAKDKLKTSQYLTMALLPLDVWFGATMVKQLSHDVGVLSARAAARTLERPVSAKFVNPIIKRYGDGLVKTQSDGFFTSVKNNGLKQALAERGAAIKSQVKDMKYWLPKYQNSQITSELLQGVRNRLIKSSENFAPGSIWPELKRFTEFQKSRLTLNGELLGHLSMKEMGSAPWLSKIPFLRKAIGLSANEKKYAQFIEKLYSYAGKGAESFTPYGLLPRGAIEGSSFSERYHFLVELISKARGKLIQRKIETLENIMKKSLDLQYALEFESQAITEKLQTEGKSVAEYFFKEVLDDRELMVLAEVSTGPGLFSRASASYKWDYFWGNGGLKNYRSIFKDYETAISGVRAIPITVEESIRDGYGPDDYLPLLSSGPRPKSPTSEADDIKGYYDATIDVDGAVGGDEEFNAIKKQIDEEMKKLGKAS